MIFPDWSAAAEEQGGEGLPLYTEWAVDWEVGAFALREGRSYTVTGDEALRIWVRRALHPESVRFLYSAYSADYGNQLAEYLSQRAEQGILESLVKKEIQETLLVSPYIRTVDGFSFTRAGSRLTVRFTVGTVYNGFTMEKEVEAFDKG